MNRKADDERHLAENGVSQDDLKAIQQRRIEQAEHRQAESYHNMRCAFDLGRMLRERNG